MIISIDSIPYSIFYFFTELRKRLPQKASQKKPQKNLNPRFLSDIIEQLKRSMLYVQKELLQC